MTGGEPLLQPGAFDFLAKIKKMGYRGKLDTNGSFPKELKEAVEKKLVDYVAMDVKNSRERYGETIGNSKIDLHTIEESMSFLMEGQVEYEFRTTVVKELHSEEEIRKIAEWISGAKIWYLQNFVDSGNLVGKQKYHGFTEGELGIFSEIAKEKQVVARIRG